MCPSAFCYLEAWIHRWWLQSLPATWLARRLPSNGEPSSIPSVLALRWALNFYSNSTYTESDHVNTRNLWTTFFMVNGLQIIVDAFWVFAATFAFFCLGTYVRMFVTGFTLCLQAKNNLKNNFYKLHFDAFWLLSTHTSLYILWAGFTRFEGCKRSFRLFGYCPPWVSLHCSGMFYLTSLKLCCKRESCDFG